MILTFYPTRAPAYNPATDGVLLPAKSEEVKKRKAEEPASAPDSSVKRVKKKKKEKKVIFETECIPNTLYFQGKAQVVKSNLICPRESPSHLKSPLFSHTRSL